MKLLIQDEIVIQAIPGCTEPYWAKVTKTFKDLDEKYTLLCKINDKKITVRPQKCLLGEEGIGKILLALDYASDDMALECTNFKLGVLMDAAQLTITIEKTTPAE